MPPGLGGPPGGDAPPPPDDPGAGPALPPLDLGAGLSEKNTLNLSISDENAPIKVQNTISKLSDVLINENENEKTEFEAWQDKKQKSEKDKKDKKNKNKRNNHLFADNPFSEYQRNRTREKNPFYDVKHDIESSNSYKKEDFLPENSDLPEYFSIDEYLDSKITQNAYMTNSIKSTLNKIKINSPKKSIIISENNSSGGNNET